MYYAIILCLLQKGNNFAGPELKKEVSVLIRATRAIEKTLQIESSAMKESSDFARMEKEDRALQLAYSRRAVRYVLLHDKYGYSRRIILLSLRNSHVKDLGAQFLLGLLHTRDERFRLAVLDRLWDLVRSDPKSYSLRRVTSAVLARGFFVNTPNSLLIKFAVQDGSAAALKRIAEIATYGDANDRDSAVEALKRINTPQAQEKLADIYSSWQADLEKLGKAIKKTGE